MQRRWRRRRRGRRLWSPRHRMRASRQRRKGHSLVVKLVVKLVVRLLVKIVVKLGEKAAVESAAPHESVKAAYERAYTKAAYTCSVRPHTLVTQGRIH